MWTPLVLVIAATPGPALGLAPAIISAPAPAPVSVSDSDSDSLSTVAERSGWLETGRYAEVEALCAAFPRRYPRRVRCERFGKTPMGRPLLALVASDDGTFSAEGARARQRPVVLLQGGIHAGEIDGKDAGFWLLRELLEGRVAKGALGRLTLLFVPVLNVDGHERFGPNQRPNQRGPAQTGWRVTAENLNLNRDYLKAEAPEMQALLRLLHRYEPVLYADLHVTDGAKFRHDVAITFEPQHTGPEAVRALGRALHVGLFAELEAKGHAPLPFYPAFVKEEDPASGFALGWPPPRLAHAYWAANHRFGVLVETHSWKDYRTRVKATFDTCAALVRLASEDGARWLKAQRAADVEAPSLAGTPVVLSYDSGPAAKPIEVLGYEYVLVKSEVSGRQYARYDETKPQVWKVPYFDELVPKLTLVAPAHGWLVPPPAAALVAAKLQLHGISFSVLGGEKKAVPVETFRSAPRYSAAPNEGRQMLAVSGEWKAEVRDLPAGTLFVPAKQARLVLAMHLLEPTAPDSLVSWGFFNAFFEQKEYLEPYLLEDFAARQLEDPAVKAQYQARLAAEPAFAASPDARLRFFFARHPAYDGNLELVPIYRAMSLPQ
jgi:hypothetical protein